MILCSTVQERSRNTFVHPSLLSRSTVQCSWIWSERQMNFDQTRYYINSSLCCSKQAWLSSLRPCNDLTTSLSIAQYNRRTKVKFLLNLTLTEGLRNKGVKYFLLCRSGRFLIYHLKVVYVWTPNLGRILFAIIMFLKQNHCIWCL